jgi:hypothetical protein
MAKGIVASGSWSRVIEGFCELLFSAPKKPLPLDPATIDVGDANTSVSLGGGSLRESEFQIPLPQGKDADPEGPRPIPVLEDDGTCGAQVPDSADGVLG